MIVWNTHSVEGYTIRPSRRGRLAARRHFRETAWDTSRHDIRISCLVKNYSCAGPGLPPVESESEQKVRVVPDSWCRCGESLPIVRLHQHSSGSCIWRNVWALRCSFCEFVTEENCGKGAWQLDYSVTVTETITILNQNKYPTEGFNIRKMCLDI